MSQSAMRFLQVLPARQGEIERSEFLLHPGQTFTFGILLAGLVLCRFAASNSLPPGSKCPRRFAGKFGTAAISIQQSTLLDRLEQGVMRMLTMNIDQILARFLQLQSSCRTAIDERSRTTGGFDHTTHQQNIFLAGKIVFPKPIRQAGFSLRGELGGDFRPRGAFAHHAGIGTLAQHQRDGVEQDGFSSAGFTGQHGKTRLEVERQALDQDKIGNGQGQQHG